MDPIARGLAATAKAQSGQQIQGTLSPLWRLKEGVLRSTGLTPSVLSVAPTVTVNCPGGGTIPATGIVNGVDYKFNGATTNYTVTDQSSWTLFFTNGSYNAYHPASCGTDGVNDGSISLIHDGQVIELIARASDSWQVLVDGQLLQAAQISIGAQAGFSIARVKIDFGSRARRHLVFFGRVFGFTGFTVGPNDTIEPYDISALPRFAFLTDSYGQRASTSFWSGPYCMATLRAGGGRWTISPGGGSGYITGGTGNKTYAQRTSNIVVGSPDCIVVAGGINDSTTGLQAGAQTVFAALRSSLPNAVLGVVGAWAPSTSYQGSSSAKTAMILPALQSVSGPWFYLDPVASTWQTSNGLSGAIGNAPWLTGSGKVGATTGSGNADIYTDTDGIHPTPSGVDYYAGLLADGFRQAILAL